jgi:hypothetical protein
VFIAADAGGQFNTVTFAQKWTTTVSVEDAKWQANYGIDRDVQYDGGVIVRVWRGLGVGGGYSRFENSGPASITGQVPHPFYFNRDRSLSGESTALSHREQAIHVSAAWLVPVSRRLQVNVFGGPSYFIIERPFVESVTYSETYPFDSVSFTGATLRNERVRHVGVHAGADIAWYFSRQVGIGGILRFARASVRFTSPPGGPVSLDAGGLQAGAGVRIRLGGTGSAAAGRGRRSRPGRGAGVATGREAPRTRRVATVQVPETPAFIDTTPGRVPLTRFGRGTRLVVLGEQAGWLQVEWDDPQWGRRVGFIPAKNVTVADEPF